MGCRQGSRSLHGQPEPFAQTITMTALAEHSGLSVTHVSRPFAAEEARV